MIPIKFESAWQGVSDCRHCGVRDMVLFADLNEQDFNSLHTPIDDFLFPAGHVLYHEGADVQGVFTLRRGMVKLVRVSSDGRPRIVRVLRPGDVVGLEALAVPVYANEAVALTEVAACRIPAAVIHGLNQHSPRLHKRLTETWQRALKDADDWLAELNFGTARQRVSQLALKMRSADMPEEVTLFSREDMGAMLDLKLETVSREISALVRDRILAPADKQGRRYRVTDLAGLRARLLP